MRYLGLFWTHYATHRNLQTYFFDACCFNNAVMFSIRSVLTNSYLTLATAGQLIKMYFKIFIVLHTEPALQIIS